MTHAPVGQIMMCGIAIAALVPYLSKQIRNALGKR